MRSKAAEKIARTGIERDDNIMYFIKQGDVWGLPRRRPGEPKERARLIAKAGVEMDYARYLYYVDGDGDVARKERFVPRPRKKRAKKKVAKKKKKKTAKKKKKTAKQKKKTAAKNKAPPRGAARDEPTTSRRL